MKRELAIYPDSPVDVLTGELHFAGDPDAPALIARGRELLAEVA